MPQTPFQGKHEADLFMEPQEFQKLLKAAAKDTDAVRAFILMGFAGLRTIEAAWVKVKDLDRQKRGLWVTTAKRKDRKVRFVSLGDWLGMFEQAAKGRRPDEQLLLRGAYPIERRQIRYLFHKYKEAAGIRRGLGPHSLRHLAGIVRSESGAQPQEVAGFLGHKTMDMVLIYANLRKERNEEMAQAASDILFGGKGRVTNPDK